jgi:hypothetical protein
MNANKTSFDTMDALSSVENCRMKMNATGVNLLIDSGGITSYCFECNNKKQGNVGLECPGLELVTYKEKGKGIQSLKDFPKSSAVFANEAIATVVIG